MTDQVAIAGMFLAKLTPASSTEQKRSYVRAAVRGGMSLESISALSNIPLNRVALIAKEG